MRSLTRVRRVDDAGVGLISTTDRPLDVCLDGRRVWTFWTLRDTRRVGPVPGPVRRVEWPKPLVRHLDAVSQLSEDTLLAQRYERLRGQGVYRAVV